MLPSFSNTWNEHMLNLLQPYLHISIHSNRVKLFCHQINFVKATLYDNSVMNSIIVILSWIVRLNTESGSERSIGGGDDDDDTWGGTWSGSRLCYMEDLILLPCDIVQKNVTCIQFVAWFSEGKKSLLPHYSWDTITSVFTTSKCKNQEKNLLWLRHCAC